MNEENKKGEIKMNASLGDYTTSYLYGCITDLTKKSAEPLII